MNRYPEKNGSSSDDPYSTTPEYNSNNSKSVHAQQMEILGKMTGGVAHDLNNLLSPIISYSEMALSDLAPDNTLYCDLEQIYDAATFARELTQLLLKFSKRQAPSLETFSLNDSITGMQKMIRRLIKRNILMDLHLDNSLDSIIADRSRIDQIILNLVINAEDAMPTGGRLTLETANVKIDKEYIIHHPDAKTGNYIMLAISDSGHGMSKETISHIFDRFFTTKKSGQGMGMGLATVKDVVNHYKGFIKVLSSEGQGTSFKIFFPRAPKEPVIVAHRETLTPPKGNGESVLITEDEDAILRLTSRILTKYGYNVITAKNAEESLRLAITHEDPIHLLLTDIVMPGMNGTDLYRRFKELRPETKVLFMSGHDPEVVKQHGVTSDDMPFLQKPFTLLSLTLRVREILDLN